MNLIKDFSTSKVLVVGDVMLDRYWWGDVTRISPEAPVPVVRLKNDTHIPGGAANVAMNAAGLGAETILLGVIGNDDDSRHLCSGLEKAGISSKHLIVSAERPTNVKTRVIAHSQQVVRVDREITLPLSPFESERINEAISRLVDDVDVILVSDYAKGTLCESVLSHLFALAHESKKTVVVDPKGKDYRKYHGAALLTPNRREAAEACHLDIESDELVAHAGKHLLDELDLDAVLITQSEHGMTLFERNQDPQHYEAASKEVYDVTGAGDTVIATLGIALAAGANFREAARLANLAAGVVVQQIGTATISREKLASVVHDASAA